MTKPLLEYCNVEVSYNGAPVVHDVSFPVMDGEVVCLVGESGSGKSTLVKAAMGQLGESGMVTRGDIWYEGSSVPDLPAAALRRLCGSDFAMVFQDCLAALTPIRRIGDQVYESMAAHRSLSRVECDEMAAKMLLQLGLEDPQRVLEGYPFNLSGGMGQRVGIALALLSQPRVLFADEPTSALDVVAQAQVIQLLKRANEELGTTVVLVTHNMGVVRALADHVLVLKDGEVVEFGEASQVLNGPQAAYTQELLDAAPSLKQGSGDPLGTVPFGSVYGADCLSEALSETDQKGTVPNGSPRDSGSKGTVPFDTAIRWEPSPYRPFGPESNGTVPFDSLDERADGGDA